MSKLEICPKCQRLSLWNNERDKTYECLNTDCPTYLSHNEGNDLGIMALHVGADVYLP